MIRLTNKQFMKVWRSKHNITEYIEQLCYIKNSAEQRLKDTPELQAYTIKMIEDHINTFREVSKEADRKRHAHKRRILWKRQK